MVDFVLPSEKQPKVVIEMKDLRSEYRKKLAAIDLAYRAIKIKERYPKVKLVAVIDGNLQNEALEIIKLYLTLLRRR